MGHLSALGLILTLIFGFLILLLIGELYYLLWWKKQRITSCNSNNSNNYNNNENYTNHTKEMLYLFCWDKPINSITTTTNQNNSSSSPNPGQDPDIETGQVGESVDIELMRLHNLVGPPRFLFTIKEESKEDLESEEGNNSNCKGKSSSTSLSELISSALLSPLGSPIIKGTPNNMGHFDSDGSNENNYSNPLFEDEMFRIRSSSSPPPTFKFLRDAEEKLYRKLVEDARRCGVLSV